VSQIQVQLYHVMVAAWTLMSANRFIAFNGNACSHLRGVTFAHIILRRLDDLCGSSMLAWSDYPDTTPCKPVVLNAPFSILKVGIGMTDTTAVAPLDDVPIEPQNFPEVIHLKATSLISWGPVKCGNITASSFSQVRLANIFRKKSEHACFTRHR
jgi:hypothetical protein